MTDASDEELWQGLLKIHAEFDARDKLRNLRRDRPWNYDVIRVLADRPAGLAMQQIYRELRAVREPSGLKSTPEFEATVRRRIYDLRDAGLLRSSRRGVWAADHVAAAKWLSEFLSERKKEN